MKGMDVMTKSMSPSEPPSSDGDSRLSDMHDTESKDFSGGWKLAYLWMIFELSEQVHMIFWKSLIVLLIGSLIFL